jgi:argininosuccinate synthase
MADKISSSLPLTVPKAPWSMDENLVHSSYEAGSLEDPDRTPVSAFDHFLHFGAVSGNVF